MLTRHWKSILGFLLSGALLWWALRDVAVDAVWQVLQASDVALLAVCTIGATAIVPLRARKWLPILEPVVGLVPFGPLWRSTAIGMMMNNVFPLRAGEFARAFTLSREVPRIALTTALGSLAVDRIFDVIVVFAMMFAAMLDPRFPSGVMIAGRTVPELAAGGVGLVLGVLLACYAVVLHPQRIVRLVRAIATRFAPRYQDPVVGFAELGVGSLAVLTDTRRFVSVLVWTVVHWGMHAIALYLGFLAVGIDVPLSAAFFLQGVLAAGVALPSSPGFFGVFEVAATVGLTVYGVPKELAISWAVSYHLLSFIPITIIGAVYFARLGLSLGSVHRAQRAPTTPP